LRKVLKILVKTLVFILLTILTQTGGIVLIISEIISHNVKWNNKLKSTYFFIIAYLFGTFIINPFIVPFFGREPIKNSDKIQSGSFITVLFNRNYVRPEFNILLSNVEQNLEHTDIIINYLDANFPFIDGFPLLPHLSHNDGKKLDISLIYESKDGVIGDKLKSNSGYGVFVEPMGNEVNQTINCIEKGYFQYDYPKYLTFGTKNSELKFSEKGTKKLIDSFLKEDKLGKLFIEPHLKTRLQINDSRVRFHGCKAVRHDDHIHLQLK